MKYPREALVFEIPGLSSCVVEFCGGLHVLGGGWFGVWCLSCEEFGFCHVQRAEPLTTAANHLLADIEAGRLS
jgi:hypothetical protein